MQENTHKKSLSSTSIIIVCLIIPIFPFVIIGELPGERWLSNNSHDSFLFGLTGATLLAADILIPVPSTVMGTLLGARLGFVPGLLWSWAGLVVGNLIGFYTGRIIFRRFDKTIPQSPTLLVLAVSRPIPVLSEAVALSAGAGGVNFVPFLCISIVANGIFAAALAANGAALLSDSLFGLGLILPMALPVGSWLLWHLKFKTHDD